MPAIGNIVINDAEATPVAHTFAPVTTDGATAKLANRAATTPKGFEALNVELRAPSGQATAYRLLVGFNDPVEATVDGSQVVVRNNSADLRLNFSPESTAQERKNTLKLMSNLLAHATVVAVAENLEPIY
jgi:hypothetical protein